MGAIDLRSDTKTKPTPAMRAAIAAAEVGDEQAGEDPTTRALEARVAELLGHEAGLLVPSGTMCNVIGFRLHLRPGGDEVILDRNAHPVRFEAGGPAAISGGLVHPLDSPAGIFTAAQFEAAIRPLGDAHAPRSRLVSIEQTTNLGGGRIWPLALVDELLAIARARGLRAHLDGARLCNAAVATAVPLARWAGAFDTAWIDLSKGLGAPIGAVLVASETLIDEARRLKQMLGGAMRQSGIIAAAGLYALDHHLERLVEDHDHARRLATALAERPEVTLDALSVETNIVVFEVADAVAWCDRLAAEGILMGPVSERLVRAVTHLDVTADDIERTIEVLARL